MAVSDEYNMEGRSILSGKREKICFPFSAKNHTQELKNTHTHTRIEKALHTVRLTQSPNAQRNQDSKSTALASV